MLDKARQLKVYDELVIAELTTYLNDVGAALDLIASDDTINYFGALETVLLEVAGALRDAGCVVFTCEEDKSEHSELGYRLNHHGRYCHTVDYLKECLAEVGLTIRGITPAVLRLEANLPVEGIVVWAHKDATR
jgi:predicted TPR repeat methyltransferase